MSPSPSVHPRWSSPRAPRTKDLAGSRRLSLDPVAAPPTLGQLAATVIGESYGRVIARERKALAADPAALHQMRVAGRRLRAALRLFGPVIRLPEAAGARRVRDLARVLGTLRDLEVQSEELLGRYRALLQGSHQPIIDRMLAQRRRPLAKARAAIDRVLTGKRYARMKEAFERWLERPRFTAPGDLPLFAALPDLLAPTVAELLLHSGWLVSPGESVHAKAPVLHDLRKTIKRTRYQVELVAPWYGDGLRPWIEDLVAMQDSLGSLQDGEVLLASLPRDKPGRSGIRELKSAIQRRQVEALSAWAAVRTRYLAPEERDRVRRMVLDLEATKASQAG
ncbi:MAG: CHAD domain-containing protein [Gemmatimonadales bacterium]